MNSWTASQLQSFAAADDFHISPYRHDGVTYGTPTFIWSVVAEGGLYVRPYNGTGSRWYQAALTQGGGCIRIGGIEYEARFVPADPGILDAVDASYRDKYSGSPYLAPMIAEGPRSTTVQVLPAGD